MCCVLCVVHLQKCVYFVGFTYISRNVFGLSEFLEMKIVDFTQIYVAMCLATGRGLGEGTPPLRV